MNVTKENESRVGKRLISGSDIKYKQNGMRTHQKMKIVDMRSGNFHSPFPSP